LRVAPIVGVGDLTSHDDHRRRAPVVPNRA